MESTSVVVVVLAAVLAALCLLLTAVDANPVPPLATPTKTAEIYTCSAQGERIEECKLTEPQNANRLNCSSLCNDPSQLVVYREKDDASKSCELLPFTKIKHPSKWGTVSKGICAPEHVQLEILHGTINVWHLTWDGVPNHDENCDAPDTSLVYRSECDTPQNCKKPRYRCAQHRIMHQVRDVTICHLAIDSHAERCS